MRDKFCQPFQKVTFYFLNVLSGFNNTCKILLQSGVAESYFFVSGCWRALILGPYRGTKNAREEPEKIEKNDTVFVDI